MKSHASSSLVLAAVLAAFASSPAFAAPQPQPALAHPVSMAEHLGKTITRGSSMSEVLLTVGMPDRKLTVDVWAYANFNGGPAQRQDDNCSTLMLTFSRGRVSDIQLVNDRAEKVYATQLRAPAPGNQAFAVK